MDSGPEIKYHAWLVKNHWCARCGRQDARTLSGKYLCFSCAEKERQYHRAYYRDAAQMQARKNKELRERRKAQGLCSTCGAALPTQAYPYRTCPKCRARRRELDTRRREIRSGFSRELREEQGLCVKCGAPRKEGTRPWTGEAYKLCDRCWADAAAGLKKGRAAYQEKYGISYGQRRWNHEHCIRDQGGASP